MPTRRLTGMGQRATSTSFKKGNKAAAKKKPVVESSVESVEAPEAPIEKITVPKVAYNAAGQVAVGINNRTARKKQWVEILCRRSDEEINNLEMAIYNNGCNGDTTAAMFWFKELGCKHITDTPFIDAALIEGKDPLEQAQIYSKQLFFKLLIGEITLTQFNAGAFPIAKIMKDVFGEDVQESFAQMQTQIAELSAKLTDR